MSLKDLSVAQLERALTTPKTDDERRLIRDELLTRTRRETR